MNLTKNQIEEVMKAVNKILQKEHFPMTAEYISKQIKKEIQMNLNKPPMNLSYKVLKGNHFTFKATQSETTGNWFWKCSRCGEKTSYHKRTIQELMETKPIHTPEICNLWSGRKDWFLDTVRRRYEEEILKDWDSIADKNQLAIDYLTLTNTGYSFNRFCNDVELAIIKANEELIVLMIEEKETGK